MVKPQKAVASFDSATGMLRALSRFLRDRDVPMLGQAPGAVEPVAAAVAGAAARLPRAAKEKAYAVSGWAEAVPLRRVPEIRSQELARWVSGHYPRGRTRWRSSGRPTARWCTWRRRCGRRGCRRRCCCRCAAAASARTTRAATCARPGRPARRCWRPTLTWCCTTCTTPTRTG
ncbi:hypothetical protein ACFQ0B_49275 [Nonomuraea thailandensis]